MCEGMELCFPLELSKVFQASSRVEFGTWVGVAFQAPPGSQASSRGQAKDSALLSSRDAGLLDSRGDRSLLELCVVPAGFSGLRCAGKAGNPFQTTQGNRLSCRDQEGRRGSEEAVPGPSVFPSGEPGPGPLFRGGLSGWEELPEQGGVGGSQRGKSICEKGCSRSFSGCGRKPCVPSTCACDLR